MKFAAWALAAKEYAGGLMADYYAVLNRTLSGFGNANAQLRTKLYERARLTIRSQLSNRAPALDENAVLAEMQKLEQAIAEIENGYGNEVPTGVLAEVEKPEEVEPPKPDTEAKPETAEQVEVETEPVPETEESSKPEAEEAEVVEVAPEEVVEEPELEVADEPKPEPEKNAEPDTEGEADSKETVSTEEPESESEAVVETKVESDEAVSEVQPEVETAEVADDEAPLVEDNSVEDTKSIEAAPVAEEDPLSAAITEFSESEAERKSDKSLDAEPIPDVTDLLEAKFLKDVVGAVDEPVPEKIPHALEAESAPDYSDPAASEEVELPPVDFGEAANDENLVIPPAIDPSSKKRGGVGRYLARFAILIALIAGLTAAVIYRSDIATSLGYADLFDDPTRPKPVKTISIKPEPEKLETEAEAKSEPVSEPKPDSEVAVKPEVESEQPAVPEPKLEQRLNESGEESKPEQPQQPILPAETDPADSTTPAIVKPKIDDPSGTQTAILYEEGAGAQAGGLDAGSVTWSVVKEAPAEGKPEEARYSCSDRNSKSQDSADHDD